MEFLAKIANSEPGIITKVLFSLGDVKKADVKERFKILDFSEMKDEWGFPTCAILSIMY